MNLLLASFLLIQGEAANEQGASERSVTLTKVAAPTILLGQAPILVQTASQELPERERLALSISTTGKYLVIGESDRLDLRDAETLMPLKELPRRWTGFGFDEEDGRLLTVGDEVALTDTRTWTPQVLGTLKNSQFAELKSNRVHSPLKPFQALVMPDLDFYYCTSEGNVALATTVGRTLESKPLTLKVPEDERVGQILGTTDNGLFLAYKGSGHAAVGIRGEVYKLVGCDGALLGTGAGTLAVCVGRTQEALYITRSWRYLVIRGDDEELRRKNLSAAIDRKTGWVFVGDTQGLRAWSVDKFSDQMRYEQFKNPVSLVAASSSGIALYTLEKSMLRRWKIN